MKRGGLLIRADAGPQIGSGHAMRMLALAEAWIYGKPVEPVIQPELEESIRKAVAGPDALEEVGQDFEETRRRIRRIEAKALGRLHGRVFWLGQLPESLAARVDDLAIERVEGDVRETADRLDLAWIAADGYHFGEAWQRTVQGGKAKLLIVDDNAENAPYVADAVLNLNVHADASLYSARAPHTQLLLGSKYALLRREFQAAGGPREVPARATRWLVTMGGADPVDATGRFLSALKDAPPDVAIEVLVGGSNSRLSQYQALAPKSVVFTPNPPDVTVPMRRADLAFSASGGTVWELALMGVPAAVISLADNQVKLRDALAKLGVVESLGDSSGDPAQWLAALNALAADPKRRAAYVQKAREQVDGQGAHRVVAALCEARRDAERPE